MEAFQIQWVVLIIGALVVAEAAVILIRPGVYRKFIKFFTYGRMLYIPAAVEIVIGILFLICALDCRQPWLIIVFGLIAAIKGVWIFLMKPQTLKNMLTWLGERSDTTLRLLGILALAVGVLIMYGGMPR
jgi:uncharacterized protein YjeT (DUF2065 family)